MPRVTVHAGEDFATPFDGLRRIHEALEFGIVQLGDRIGHGVAVGTDTEDWIDLHPDLAVTRETRLDDVVWLLELVANRRLNMRGSEVRRLQHELDILLGDIFGQDGPLRRPQEQIRSRRWRHCLEYPIQPCASLDCPRCWVFDWRLSARL